MRKFKIDQWVLYCRFPDSQFGTLKEERTRAVILEALGKRDLYDYSIFIDDGSGAIKKVKEENLFPCEKTK